jgi:beta-glucosidase-like glycosyl hydrolase/CubicO group peptidase (beta-lactamase class C family)
MRGIGVGVARFPRGVRRGALGAFGIALGLWGCSGGPGTSAGGTVAPSAAPPSLSPALDAEARAWVDEALASLSLREAVGQLVFEWIPGAYVSPTSPEFAALEELVVDYGVGGVSISIGLPHSYAAKLNALQSRARIPLLVTSDFENGGPGMRINHSYALPSLLAQGGGTSFPSTMAFGAIGDERWAREYGRVTAVEARALGVHLNFAPVMDVNSNPENPIIATRSFGEDPAAVSRLGTAFIRGAREGGQLTTAKHFPGHGDTRTDSHIGLPVVDADRARLDAMELVPFQAAVDEGVDLVMTAHVAMPEVLGPNAPPATLAPEFMTQILRDDMGFDGVVITDALRMGAIAEGYGVSETALLSLEAGSDILLAPADVAATIEAVVGAVEDGRIPRARVDASVRRILELKARVGLHRNRMVDLEGVDDLVGSGAHLALADSAAALSMTLVRDHERLVPTGIAPDRNVLSLTLARPSDLTAGSAFNAALAPYTRGLSRARVNQGASEADRLRALKMGLEADLVVVGAYLPPRAGAGSVGVPPEFASLIRELALARPTVLVSFGSPYILAATPDVGTYLVAWGPREVSQKAAARALVGAAPISGRLPISLPPFHRLGEGEDRAEIAAVAALDTGIPDALDETGMVVQRREAGDAVGSSGGAPGGYDRRAPGGPDEGLAPEQHRARGFREGEVEPATVGMSADGLAVADSMVLAAIEDGAFPGAALAIGRRGRVVRLRGYGSVDWAQGAEPATERTIWDLASLTKVAGTTTATMILVEDGTLSLDDRVVEYWPEWSAGDARKEEVTLRHLLLHRAGLPPFRTFFNEMDGRRAYRSAFEALPLDYDPGTDTAYSDIGLQTLAFVIEEVTGTRIDALLRERVWEPLGMRDTDFNPDPATHWRVAPTEVDENYRGTHVHGVVHDENAYAQSGVAGHAGLFSTARDLSVFARMMLGGGEYMAGPEDDPREGGRLLRAETIDGFTARFDDSSSRALGWDTPTDRSSSGLMVSERAFGHTGFTGTSMWVDPELDLFVILLTNRVNPTRENTKLFPLRRALADQVVRSVTDVAVEPRR